MEFRKDQQNLYVNTLLLILLHLYRIHAFRPELGTRICQEIAAARRNLAAQEASVAELKQILGESRVAKLDRSLLKKDGSKYRPNADKIRRECDMCVWIRARG